MTCIYTYNNKSYTGEELIKFVDSNEFLLPKLREFVNSQGFSVGDLFEYIKDYEARTGNKWEAESSNALIDLTKKIIAVKEGKDAAFNEEAVHLAIALSPKGPKFERALEKVVGTEMYNLYADRYRDNYTKLEKNKPEEERLTSEAIERKVRIEILGKLLLETLVNEQNAKESFGAWLVRFLKQAWNNFIGKFKTNDLADFLTEVSHNINLQNSEFFNNTIDDQGILLQLEETESLDPITKLRDQVLHDKRLRLKRLRERKRELDAEKLKAQINEIEELEAEIGIRKFAEFLWSDLKENLKFIDKVLASDKPANDLMLANLRDFLSFYKPSLDQLNRFLNVGNIQLDRNNVEDKKLKKRLKKSVVAFKKLQDFHDDALTKRIAANTKEEFKDKELDFDIDKLLDEKAKDISAFQTYFGTPRDVGEAFTRIIYRLVGKLTITVRQLANQYGKQLINKVYQDFDGDTNIKRFAERDANGKTTGYFINSNRMGAFDKSLENMRERVKNAESEDEATKIKEDWFKENVERRFKQAYYDLRATLSDQTNEALDRVDASINAILNKYKKQDLTVDLTEISEQDWTKLKQARIARKRLANLYNQDGTKKSGLNLDIAEELKAYNEKYWENVDYRPNMDAFNEAMSQIPKSKRKLWYERNTELQYSKEFWELFNQLNKRDFGDEYTELNEERLELLRPFRIDNQELEIENLPEAIKDRVKAIDQRLQAIREETPIEEQNDDLKFSDIADITRTEAYYAARQKAKAEGREEQWVADNHYYTSKGYRKPYSYWTKFVPKKKEHIERVPTREWSELDPESNWYNPNYDPNHAGFQPKASKWKNNEYDKLSDKDKKYLNYIIEEKHKADKQMGIQPNYRMPQLSKSFMDVMYGRSNLLSGLKELAIESVSRRTDDDVLFGDPDNEYRSDGTKVNYVARKYTRLIEDPSVISTDILSGLILYKEAAINYEEMTKAAPQLENLQEQLGNRQFERGKRRIKGKESDVYRLTRSFIDAQVYNIMMNEGKNFTIAGIEFNTAKLTSTINNYVRNNNLIFNTFSILSNITGGFINANIDRVIGRYSTATSNNKAMQEFGKNIVSVVAEYNKPIKKNKMSQVLEFFNVVSSNEELFDNLDKTSIRRLKPSDLTYAGWNQGGYFLRAVPALAVMFNQRYDGTRFIGEKQYLERNPDKTKNDYYKLTSIYDMLEVKDNSTQVKKEYKNIVTQDYLAQLNALITQRITQVDGNVTPLDRAIAHRDVWLKLVTTHRGWFIDGIARRFKAESKNLLTGYKEVGYHRYFFTEFLGKAFLTTDRKFTMKQIFQTEFWNTLEPHQKEAAYRSLLELAIMFSMMIIARAINNMADDDEELDWAAYLSNRTLMETSALSPSPMALMELTQIINSPIAGVRQVETLMDIGDIFSGEEIESGKYEGLSKRQRLLIKLMPGVKGYYGSSDPGSSNQFLKSKSLRWLY